MQVVTYVEHYQFYQSSCIHQCAYAQAVLHALPGDAGGYGAAAKLPGNRYEYDAAAGEPQLGVIK